MTFSRRLLFLLKDPEIHSNFPKSFSGKAARRDVNLGLLDGGNAPAFHWTLLLPGVEARRCGGTRAMHSGLGGGSCHSLVARGWAVSQHPTSLLQWRWTCYYTFPASSAHGD